ncbi:D-inositol 3-phosphate glycosyltransferase-like isoform X5 [Acropora palmata]|uniref:D-inositol 3-phosphate glycosyltransferase-like isoform X5 n=1 Tax=Acropora palmata TaxID=6131 RepID=UPI003DA176B6
MASFVSCLHKHGTSPSSSKVQVIILASEWGSSKGGLSTINRELAIQLAKFPCLQVTFFLPKCADEDKKAAESHGVSIVVATRRPGYKELGWLSFPPGHLKIDVVVGHGVKLGRQAQVICESHNCKWVQVVHTDPEELGMFKGYENSISKGEEKHHVEKELCRMADFVVGVGPKLAEAFRKYLGSCKKHQDVFEFTPGIFDEFSSVQQIPDERKQCRVLVFGRGDEEDFKLKGFDIAAKAVAALSDTILVFVGSPHGKQEEIAKQFIDFGIPANRLRVRSYMEREALKELFYEVDLVLMPSRTEGFGLTGLEALSAGLPVLVSKNSGFGEALDSIQVGSIFVMDSEDHSTWTGAIKDIWDKDRRSRLDEVKTVRDFYAERYSWSEQCKHLVEKMIRLLDGAQGGHEKKRSLSDHQEISICSSSGSTSESFLREGPDQPEEVSAGGTQGMRPRSNAVSRKCRKPPIHAVREENPDQPSVSAGGTQGMRPRSNAVSRKCRKPPIHAVREENPDQPSGAQGGHEKKRSLSDHQEISICSSSGSTSESFLREGPDQPEEASGPQRKRSRSNQLSNWLRKPSSHAAVKEENPDQPSGQSSTEVTIVLFPKIPKAGSRVEFKCTARESQQVFYQWYKDGQELQGQYNSSLILNALKVQDFGFYKCEVRSDKRNDSIDSGRARLYTC